MIRDPRDLGEDYPDVLRSFRNLYAQQLLNGETPSEVVDDRRDVVQPVGVRHDLVVIHRLTHLLEATVEVPNVDVSVDNLLSRHLRDDPNSTVRRGVRWPKIHHHRVRVKVVPERTRAHVGGNSTYTYIYL